MDNFDGSLSQRVAHSEGKQWNLVPRKTVRSKYFAERAYKALPFPLTVKEIQEIYIVT